MVSQAGPNGRPLMGESMPFKAFAFYLFYALLDGSLPLGGFAMQNALSYGFAWPSESSPATHWRTLDYIEFMGFLSISAEGPILFFGGSGTTFHRDFLSSVTRIIDFSHLAQLHQVDNCAFTPIFGVFFQPP